jgi:hypothetical protein
MEYGPNFESEARFGLEQQAHEYIALIKHALELNARVKSGQDVTAELIEEAKAAANTVLEESKKHDNKLPFNIKVRLTGGTRGQESANWHITDPHAYEFEATAVTLLNPDQIDFLNESRGTYLSAFGHEMDLEPLITEGV